MGEFLIGSDKVRDPKTGEWYCSKEENGTLHRLFCDIPVNHITGGKKGGVRVVEGDNGG